MSGITFYRPLQTKCYMLKNKGKNHSLLWTGGHHDDYQKPVSRVRASSCPFDGPNAGGESVAVRGADNVGVGGKEGQWLQKYRGEVGSPERFLRTQQALPLGQQGATMATVQ